MKELSDLNNIYHEMYVKEVTADLALRATKKADAEGGKAAAAGNPERAKAKRAQALAIRWLIDSARKRKDKHMSDKIFNELYDAYEKKGAAVKKREDVHKMAESNKAFAHFRW